MNTNTNVKCLLGLNDPDTADFYARHLGTSSSERKTERIDGGGWMTGSRRTGDGFIDKSKNIRFTQTSLKISQVAWACFTFQRLMETSLLLFGLSASHQKSVLMNNLKVVLTARDLRLLNDLKEWRVLSLEQIRSKHF